MAYPPKTEGPEIIQFHTRATPTAATVWLHALGTNAADMDSVTTRLPRTREIGVHHVAPSAPLRRVRMANSQIMRAWFDVDENAPTSVPDGIVQSTALVHEVLDSLIANGRAPDRIVLGGFSQGAVQALHAALRYPQQLAGVVILAGELVDPPRAANQVLTTMPPMLMIHGSRDQVIDVESARADMQTLRGRGVEVEWHEVATGHELTPAITDLVDDWIARRLAATSRQETPKTS